MSIRLFGFSLENLYFPVHLPVKSFLFSAGEVQVRIPAHEISKYERVLIEVKYPDSKEILETILLINAITSVSGFKGSIVLFMPYLPYSRQDRVCHPGEAVSIQAFSKTLFGAVRSEKDKIITWDVHSKSSLAAFRSFGGGIVNIPADTLINKFFPYLKSSGYVVVSPDDGAVGRAEAVAKAIGSKTVMYGRKERNSDDGSIVGISVTDKDGCEPDLSGKSVMIVDDICDGGRTFIELAKVLKSYGSSEIVLYVTHGIFSKGFEVFQENGEVLINTILVSNLFPHAQLPPSKDGVERLYGSPNTPTIGVAPSPFDIPFS